MAEGLTTDQKVTAGTDYLRKIIEDLPMQLRESLVKMLTSMGETQVAAHGLPGSQGETGEAATGGGGSESFLGGHPEFIIELLKRVSTRASQASGFQSGYAPAGLGDYERGWDYNPTEDFLESIWREYFPQESFDSFRGAIAQLPPTIGEFGGGAFSGIGSAAQTGLTGAGEGELARAQALRAMPGAIGEAAGQGFSNLGTAGRGVADFAGETASGAGQIYGGVPGRIQNAITAIQGLGPMQRPQQYPVDPGPGGPQDSVPAFQRPGLPQQGFQEVLNRILGLLRQ